VKEPEAWQEHRTDWTTYRKSLPAFWKRFAYLVALMAIMNLMSHGTQDMYPTLLASVGYAKTRIADITMFAGLGAILGGLAFRLLLGPRGSSPRDDDRDGVRPRGRAVVGSRARSPG